MVRHACPHCECDIESSDKKAGPKIACPECGGKMRVPQPAAKAATGRAPRKRKRAKGILDDLPALPEEADALGEPLATYDTKNTAASRAILITLGIGFCFGSIVRLAVAWGTMGIEPILSALILVGIGAFLLFCGFSNAFRHVVVFTNGLVNIEPGAAKVIPWTDIEKVWQSITEHHVNDIRVMTTYLYTIETRDGDQLEFGMGLPDVQVLGDTIQQEVSRVLVPRMLEAYEGGEKLTFGPLVVDESGLTMKSEFLRWEDIQEVKLAKGAFVVRKKGKWFKWGKVPVPDVPNLWVFLVLVDKILGIDSPIESKKFS
jgi:hypothetical protein